MARVSYPDPILSSTGLHLESSHFDETLMRHFPGSRPSQEFIDYSLCILKPFGFQPDNSMACASVCRDELTRPFINKINPKNGSCCDQTPPMLRQAQHERFLKYSPNW